ncbi:MAG: DUF4830 domain-containing protein [Oscillospiraceae bacterium]|nr:DUF4830 domain-containing protein [Oscillospiraceae bacterium]
MMVMTAKVDKKKIAIIFAAVVVAIAALVMLLGGGRDASPTATTNVSNNDARVEFLKGFGWDVTTSPVESSQVRIPEKSTQVFDRYNEMQKQQGYDLTQYAGKTVMRYVYKINNYPGAIEPVYATLLIYKNQVIGGDVTDTAAKGHIHGFKKPEQSALPTAPTTTATEPTATDPTSATGVTE